MFYINQNKFLKATVSLVMLSEKSNFYWIYIYYAVPLFGFLRSYKNLKQLDIYMGKENIQRYMS